jgi:ribosome-binding ATPase YchF (GTP1/OBG family)
LELTADERALLAGFQLLTQKPLIQVINVSEDLAAKEAEIGALWGAEPPLVVAARIEAEIAGLETADRATFLADLGLEAPALERMVRASYRILGMIAFFTVGDDEVRAWTITAGTKAQAAAGEIHSDLERGFIRAEVVSTSDLLAEGSLEACKKRGILRLEGKDYLVQDADVIAVRFSV